MSGEGERPPEEETPIETPEVIGGPEVVEEPEPADSPESPEPAGSPGPLPPEGPEPSLRQVLEAVLFTTSLPISPDRLKEILGVEDRREVRALVEELRIDYEAGGRAFQIEEISGGYVILTRPEYAPVTKWSLTRSVPFWIRTVATAPRPLSN